MHFEGNLVALVTPFHDGRLAADAFRRLIDRAVDGGVAALVPCGTTGESPTLTHQEHDEVVAQTCEIAAGRVPVVAGTGSNSTAEAVRLTRAAAAAGADAVLSVTPYYNRPSQEGLYRHFAAVADASDLPVVLYDIPGRTGVALELETTVRLAAHPNVQAIKEATGKVENVSRIRGGCDLAVLSGDDALALPMIALGARGVVSVLSNLLPRRMTELCEHALAGRMEPALALHERLFPLMRALFVDTNPVPVKTALAELGIVGPELRLPLCPMDDGRRRTLSEALEPFRSEA